MTKLHSVFGMYGHNSPLGNKYKTRSIFLLKDTDKAKQHSNSVYKIRQNVCKERLPNGNNLTVPYQLVYFTRWGRG